MVKGTMVTFSLDLTNQRLSAGDIRWQLFLLAKLGSATLV